MIDLTMNRENLKRAIARAREKGIIIPTFAQMQDPDLIPQSIKDQLTDVGLWDINPLNLFRITWRNNPKEKGGDGKYGFVNYIEVPSALSGVKARIELCAACLQLDRHSACGDESGAL